MALPKRLADLAEVLALLEGAGVPCLVFGGWAEELLDLRAPRPHRDIDLVHLSDSFVTADVAFGSRRLPDEIRAKRFPHKRAFAWRSLCCEILLIQDFRAAGELVLGRHSAVLASANRSLMPRDPGRSPVRGGFGSQSPALSAPPSRHRPWRWQSFSGAS